VWERDGGRCAWPLEGGCVCGSTHQLELDHIDGWALGGSGAVVYVAIPAGQTGNVVGAFDAVVGGNHCVEGSVTVNVTAHGSGRGTVVAGSLGLVSITCPVGPTPQTVSASFSATRI
jgi:hypothetical protein